MHVCVCLCVCSVTQQCLTLWGTMDCSLPDCSVHRIFQERILEWVAITYSGGSSQSRDQTPFVSGGFLGRQIPYPQGHLGSSHFYLSTQKSSESTGILHSVSLSVSLDNTTHVKMTSGDVRGGPVVKISLSNAGDTGSVPGRGAKIPHASWSKTQNIKQKQYCSKFNKDFFKWSIYFKKNF